MTKLDAQGDKLISLCSKAKSDIVLVSPFVKVRVLSRIVEAAGRSIPIILVTRWDPREIAAGVSDLAVWELLGSRENSAIRLLPTLHAKYYRVDQSCLVGSANLTERGLGFAAISNVELLLPRKATEVGLPAFEQMVLHRSLPAHRDLVEEIQHLASQVPQPPGLPPVTSSAEGRLTSSTPWHPQLRHPERLYRLYVGDDPDDRIGQADVRALSPPAGLQEKDFNAWVGLQLLDAPLVNDLDDFVGQPRRFGAIVDFLESRVTAESREEVKYHWQTLMRWLRHFLPHRYELRTPGYSEIFSRRY